MEGNFKKIIDRAVGVLEKNQQLNGGFLSYSSPSKTNFSQSQPYNTIFTSALILSALHHINSPKIKNIQKKVVRFLFSEKSPHWTFNYWSKSAPEYEALPYPDDLDDTFCALAALMNWDKSLITGEVLASIIHILTSLEVDEGGPYKTWIAEQNAEKIWQDVDIAVNANIAYFLILNKIDLPNLTTLIESAIQNEKYESPYYPTPYPILYFISRWYTGDLKYKAITYLESLQGKNHWDNPLNASCAVSALLRFGYDPSLLANDITYIAESLKKPQPHAFYTGINPKRDRTYYAGSASLTTALSLEAITLYNDYMKLTQQKKSEDSPFALLHSNTLNFIDKRIKKIRPEIEKIMTAYTEKLRKTDNDVKIILLPYLFFKSTHQSKKLSDDFFIKLGAANLYGWIAYTIYDDFLDEEGVPSHLSTANLCLRELTSIFEDILPDEHNFKNIFHDIMDKIDEANAWETSYCRLSLQSDLALPDFADLQQLANKSLGHALGPLAVVLAHGFTSQTKEYKKTLEFFTHYLIARQINDDAHDWEHDLRKGQLNAVSAAIIKKAHIKNIENADFEKLSELFWTEIVNEIAEIMLYHSDKAKKAVVSNPIISDKNFLFSLLQPIEQSAQKVISEQKKAKDFLKAYNPTI